MFKKAMSDIVVIAFLLLIVTAGFVVVQNWHLGLSSVISSDIEDRDFSEKLKTEIKAVEHDVLYFNNYYDENLTIRDVLIDGISCGLSAEVQKGFVPISLASCTYDEGIRDIAIVTDVGVFDKKLYVDKSTYATYVLGACPIGSTKIMALEFLENSHAEIGSSNFYTYNLCINHNIYDIGTRCSGSHARLFYLDNEFNAHSYTDTSSPYESEWHEVCVSVDNADAVVETTISAVDPGDGSKCALSIEPINNVNGVHLGDCFSSYTDKVWIKIE